MENKTECVNKIEYYFNGHLKSISGSQEFIDKYKNDPISKKSPTPVDDKWRPESITLKIYKGFTEIRVLLFYILIILYTLNALYSDIWVNLNWKQEDLASIVTHSIYLLLTVGALVASWLTIVLNIIKTSTTNIDQWEKLLKYVLYPIVTAIIISIVIFLQKLGIIIPAPFTLSLFIGFLVLNALYTTIKEAEGLINATSKSGSTND